MSRSKYSKTIKRIQEESKRLRKLISAHPTQKKWNKSRWNKIETQSKLALQYELKEKFGETKQLKTNIKNIRAGEGKVSYSKDIKEYMAELRDKWDYIYNNKYQEEQKIIRALFTKFEKEGIDLNDPIMLDKYLSVEGLDSESVMAGILDYIQDDEYFFYPKGKRIDKMAKVVNADTGKADVIYDGGYFMRKFSKAISYVKKNKKRIQEEMDIDRQIIDIPYFDKQHRRW